MKYADCEGISGNKWRRRFLATLRKRRSLGIPIIAGLAYELLRMGARYEHSSFMRALMAPGLWLQKITTKPPDRDQIDVAIASFNEVLRAETQLPAAEA